MNGREVPERQRALLELFDETVALFHRLRAVAETVHEQGTLTAARRGVLRSLRRAGPRTVPQMARERRVSRQHVQTLVNGLLKDGLVELVDNPAHKRSRLVRLTPRGDALISQMNRREDRLLADLEVGVPPGEIRQAARTLRALREFFADERWPTKKSQQSKKGVPE